MYIEKFYFYENKLLLVCLILVYDCSFELRFTKINILENNLIINYRISSGNACEYRATPCASTVYFSICFTALFHSIKARILLASSRVFASSVV